MGELIAEEVSEEVFLLYLSAVRPKTGFQMR